MSEHHRSRAGWPAMQERRVGTSSKPRRRALSILYLVVTLNMLFTALVFGYVLVLKSARDTEQQRIERRIEINNCALLDQLPAGGPLTRLRTTYHCGPGLPVSPTTRP